MPPTQTSTPSARRSTQRDRLLSGMIDAVNRNGYAEATIAQVLRHAGVSRPTFYEYFTDKQDCFLAALTDTNEKLARDISAEIARHGAPRALRSTINVLVECSSREPQTAWLIMNEAMAGGPTALDARDRGIAEVAGLLEAADASLSERDARPDLPYTVLLGAVHRLLARRLRREERPPPELAGEILAWLDTYRQAASGLRWRTLEPVAPHGESRFAPATPLRAPDPAPPGSSRRARRANQRERILFATARATQEKGYTESSVADITRIAGVDHRAFSAIFDSKQDAYLAVQELGFLRTMSATAGGFFAGGSWPERTWNAGLAFTQFLQRNPTIAHVGFVESYAVGGNAVKRIDEILTAFTLFLQEGQRFRRGAVRPTQVAVEAIAAANFELAYQQARRGADTQIGGMLAHAIYATLAPFVGAAEANRLIQERLSARTS